MIRSLARNADNVIGAALAFLLCAFVVGVMLKAAVKYAPENIGNFVETVGEIAGFEELR